mmetsp:Transcript_45369/g.84627  ORF Transcript_45369/g.84627 Transcript_45369/m.84627 type:complete len:208 (-) Transcript_45369:28-651(-)
MREAFVLRAAAFLQQPSMADSSFKRKLEFLDSKGVTLEEVEEACRRVAISGSYSSYVSGQSPSEQVLNQMSNRLEELDKETASCKTVMLALQTLRLLDRSLELNSQYVQAPPRERSSLPRIQELLGSGFSAVEMDGLLNSMRRLQAEFAHDLLQQELAFDGPSEVDEDSPMPNKGRPDFMGEASMSQLPNLLTKCSKFSRPDGAFSK